ncbi:histidine phosphatase family protein [Mesobaculum littorinae]|uniref:Histidine phosphatase family protein n=2 Tax=Mesobaculum littorinae TaxID=2486419 RepID=A0A438ADI4_9RHOB|nr:histidine phosphatase family protein [Mesobaculum littorinae]
MCGWTDLPADLSDTAALDRLAAALPAGAPVISSDLLRARQTAAALARGRPRLPDDPALREMHFGAWEGRTHADVEAENPTLIRRFWETPGPVAPPDGESWDRLAARVDAAADRLAAEAAHRGGDVIVVAHFGPILSQIARARAIPPQEAFAQPVRHLSLTRLRRDDRWSEECADQVI